MALILSPSMGWSTTTYVVREEAQARCLARASTRRWSLLHIQPRFGNCCHLAPGILSAGNGLRETGIQEPGPQQGWEMLRAGGVGFLGKSLQLESRAAE